MNKQNTLCMIVIVCLLSLICMTSFAEDAKDVKAENEQDSKWEFIMVPYLWMTGIDGDVTVKGREADVDVSFDEILDDLDIALLTNLIAKKGRFDVRGDIGGFDISDDTSDLSWQAIGLFEYDLSKRIILGAGYRALDIRYETGSGNDKNGINATIHGPVLGVGIRF